MSIEFAKLGAVIVAWDINDESLNKTKKLVEEVGARCHCYNVDVTNRQQVYDVARRVREDIGRTYILINNAGIVIGKDLLKLEDDEIMSKYRWFFFSFYLKFMKLNSFFS